MSALPSRAVYVDADETESEQPFVKDQGRRGRSRRFAHCAAFLQTLLVASFAVAVLVLVLVSALRPTGAPPVCGVPLASLSDSGCGANRSVWLLATDPLYDPDCLSCDWFERLRASVPVCAVLLDVGAVPKGRTFWEAKSVAIRDYLLAHPDLELVVVSDLFDVYLNPFSEVTLLERFHKALGHWRSPYASVVFAAERWCWIGKGCPEEFAERALNASRSQYTGRTFVPLYLNSQFMGTAPAVLRMLTSALGAKTGVPGWPREAHPDDQAMYMEYFVQHAEEVALDLHEEIFAIPFPRDGDGGWIWQFAQGKPMATFRREADGGVAESTQERAPLLWHFNGPGHKLMMVTQQSDDEARAFLASKFGNYFRFFEVAGDACDRAGRGGHGPPGNTTLTKQAVLREIQRELKLWQ